MVLIPCQGCRDGYDCYNQDQCSEFYAASYYSNGSVFYDQIQQVNQSNDFSAYVSQNEFTNYHQPQPFYFQSHPYTTPYYQALYHRPGYQGQSQYNNHDNNIISDNLLHQDYMPSLDIVSSLNVTEKSTENIRRAISYVRRSRNATLFSIEGFIPEVACADDATRTFIQRRLKNGSEKELRLGFIAAMESFQLLVNNEQGCCMLQDILVYGTDEMKEELLAATHKAGIITLSTSVHGCRLIQRAIRSINHRELNKFIDAFRGHVITMIHDPYGNHVIQRCIHMKSAFAKDTGDMVRASEIMDQIQFVIDDVVENIEPLSLHKYGCRVVQRSIEHCTDKQRVAMLDAITACNERIAEDLYGNYVLQQVIITGTEIHRKQILNNLIRKEGNIFRLSKQKCASNVVEKMLQHGNVEQKNLILDEILKINEETRMCSAVLMAQDPIANYVIKKAIETAPEGTQKSNLLQVLSYNRDELLKSPYAKYIVQVQ